MGQQIRAFIAVSFPCPDRIRPVLRQLSEMEGKVRPVAADTMHVTLKFLGDVDRDLVPQIINILKAVTAGNTAFELHITGVGAFPNVARPTVAWAGLQNAEPLRRLAAALEGRLEPLGIPRERRDFHPHLTLARVKHPPEELTALFAEYADADFGSVAINSVEVFQSILKPDGPVYTQLATVKLQ